MKKFLLPMPGMQIGSIDSFPVKNANGDQIGERTVIQLDYMGGFVRVDVDKAYSEELKLGAVGEATIEMQPVMSAEAGQRRDGSIYKFLATGFENFKLIGFKPNSSLK